MTTPAFRLVGAEPQQPDVTRVCDISFKRDSEHEARCILAIRRREHPAWSQHAVSYRVTDERVRRMWRG